eukprot:2227798-Amphidinium_carterae.1
MGPTTWFSPGAPRHHLDGLHSSGAGILYPEIQNESHQSTAGSSQHCSRMLSASTENFKARSICFSNAVFTSSLLRRCLISEALPLRHGW